MISPARFEPTISDIEDAARRLTGWAVRTPLLESPALNERVGGRLLIKAEPMQRTGSFKFRGAFNRMSRLNDDEKRHGVVAYSSGNHAQGVAAAAQLLRTPAVIVMPADAPAIKVRNTRSYGAEIVSFDRYRDDREAIGARLRAERGAVLVPPYEDPYVVAGQGTVGLEIVEQARERDVALDAVLVCCGGGGLSAGTATAIAARSPGTKIFVVEPEGFDDTGRSLRGGHRVTNSSDATTICDALMAPTPGEFTFSINSRLVSGGLAVTDDDVRRAMAAAFAELKLVVEPGGAVALAAVLSGKYPARDKSVAVICSGGNVDPETFMSALRAA